MAGCASAMNDRNDIIYEEAADLWRRLRGEPAPEGVDGPEMLALILGDLPDARYERLADSHLRPSNIVFPRRA